MIAGMHRTWSNLLGRDNVLRLSPTTLGGEMSLLKRLFGGKQESPKQRIRVCIECGMPLAEHRDWCAVLRHQLEREAAKPLSQ